MAFARRKIPERHSVLAADLCLQLVDGADKAIGRQPACHGVRLDECAIDLFRLGGEYAVQADSAGHGFLPLSLSAGVGGLFEKQAYISLEMIDAFDRTLRIAACLGDDEGTLNNRLRMKREAFGGEITGNRIALHRGCNVGDKRVRMA